MLTKNDLQAIKGLLKTEIDLLKEDVGFIKDDVGVLKDDVKTMKTKLNRAAKDIHYMSRKFDEQIVFNRRRVEKIEDHLHLESPKN